ncbi:hypothetical protein GF420_04890 [candidate division GN15 bacterium]|nr:hypothetical protein [candidate division GN15 bacterium]
MFFGSACGGTAIEPGDFANFVIWGGHATSGIRVGGLLTREDSLRVEIPVTVTVVQHDDEMILLGRAWLTHLNASTEITGGCRTAIRQPIRFNDPVLLRLGRLPNGVAIALNITVSREPISGGCTVMTQPIQLVTVQYLNGRMRSHHATGRPASAHPSLVKTYFSLPADIASPSDRQVSRILEYWADIRFSVPPDSIGHARLVDFELTRTYRIDTLHQEFEDMRTDLAWTSTYRHRLELEPGVELRIVVPPDTPIVGGFVIEDTLIIVPPK